MSVDFSSFSKRYVLYARRTKPLLKWAEILLKNLYHKETINVKTYYAYFMVQVPLLIGRPNIRKVLNLHIQRVWINCSLHKLKMASQRWAIVMPPRMKLVTSKSSKGNFTFAKYGYLKSSSEIVYNLALAHSVQTGQRLLRIYFGRNNLIKPQKQINLILCPLLQHLP